MFDFMKAIYDFVYPHCCICCGEGLHNQDLFICDYCCDSRFEQPLDQDHFILPDHVSLVYSMWKFDKGGYLQEILHQLKYNRQIGAGKQLGRLIGAKLNQIQLFIDDPPLLIPIPLHPSKERYRGFNQSRAIADGIEGITGWPIVDNSSVIRVKKTKTQTGLTTERRVSNLQNAFAIPRPEELRLTAPVIVDDVFTTGTTTFELSKTIFANTGKKSIILTIARA
ncbi:MAG: ComF family protein [Balneolaceae bacterium]